MLALCARRVMLLAICTHCRAAPDLQIPECTSEVVNALKDTARAEPLHIAKVTAAHCLTDRPGRLTLLHEAARSGAYGSIQQLIEQGADPFAIDRRGATPLHWAASQGSDEAIQSLLDSLSLEKRAQILRTVDLHGLTALDYAEANSRIRAAIALVRNGAVRSGEDLTEGACSEGAVDAVLLGRVGDLQELLKESASYFSISVGDCTLSSDPREWSLLHLATAVAAAAAVTSESATEIVRQLLAHGIDATREDAYGQSPVYFAVKAGRLDLVQLLLDSEAREVNHLDFLDHTPLSYAAMTGREEVAKLLLAKGADADHADQDGLSARDWALENGHENLVDALSVGPRGVRGSTGKSALPRRAVHGTPFQELCIIAAILVFFIWLRMGALHGFCLRPKLLFKFTRCRRAEPAVVECCS